MSLNLIIVGILVVLSLLFGRIYCSTICPLGVFQDVLSWKSRFFRKKKKKNRFEYKKPQNILRYSILALTIIAFISGSSALIILLDPYSIFGRFVTELFQPLVIWGNNLLVGLLSKMGNYFLFPAEQIKFIPLAFFITFAFFVLVGIFSWFRGRLYCNTVCPVGTTLGLLSKFSVFHITINESTCTSCGSCQKKCKSECIDIDIMKVDDTRCVTCFDCLSACKKNSIKYSFRYKKQTAPVVHETPANNSRRTFLLASASIVTTLAFAKTQKVLGKNDPILNRKPILPPGAQNTEHFNRHCTACQLCVNKCPMQVLKPAALQYGISGIMQPHLMFSTHEFCTYDCNICTTVCPTEALKPLTLDEKKLTQIGIAKFRKDLCVVYTDETDCGACSEHCPTQAVHMIPYKNGLTIPEVTDDICIGCGACESICPVRPYQAIYVEGNAVQAKAKKPQEAKKFDKVIDDFGF